MTLQNIYVQRFLGLVFVICAAAAATFLLLHQTRPATAGSDAVAADQQGATQQVATSELSVDDDHLLGALFVKEGILTAYPVLLDPLAQGGFGQPGAYVTHTLYLDNIYWTDTSYSLSLEPGHEWPATLVPTQTAVLTPGMRIPITVSVAVPLEVGEGDMDSLTLQAVADGFPSVNETALVDTAVICEPHLVIGPQKIEFNTSFDQVYEYVDQYFAYVLVHARTISSSSWHTYDATVSGYDPDTDSWVTLAEVVNINSGPVIHETLLPSTYTKIRVQIQNNNPNITNVIYTHQFALCRQPTIFWEPAGQSSYVAAGETAVYTQTLTNWTMTSTPFTLTVAENSWPVTFWHDGAPLTTTAVLSDQESLEFQVHVAVPPDAEPAELDLVNVGATAVASPTIQSSVTITTAVTGDPVYVTMGQGSRLGIVDSAHNVYLQTIVHNQYNCFIPTYITITPDGQHLYVSCSNSNTVLVVETDTNTVVQSIDFLSSVKEIAFSQDGQYAFVTGQWNTNLFVIDTTTFFYTTIPIGTYVHSLAAHPLLDRLYVSTTQSQVKVLDTTSLTIVDTIENVNVAFDWLEISSDGVWLFATGQWHSSLTLVNLYTHEVTTVYIDGVNSSTDMALAPDGATLYLGGQDKIHVIDTATLTEEAVVPVTGTVWAAELTCDGSQLYVSSQQNTLFAIDTDTLAVTEIPMPASGLRGVAVCPQYVETGFVLSPLQQQKQAALGETAVYSTTIYNQTGQTDFINLSLGGATWPADLSAASIGPLAHGESATFTVTVTVSDEASWYETDMVTITATSVTSPTVYSNTAVLTTEAFAPAQLTFDPTSLNLSQEVNSQMTQTMTLSNGNGVTLTFALQTAQHLPVFDPFALSLVQRPEVEMTPTASMLFPPLHDPTEAWPPLVTILTDPLGDGGVADVVEVLAGRTDTAVSIQIKFAPGVNMRRLGGFVLLDTDQDTSTGRPPTAFSGLSTQEVGVDYVVSFFSTVNTLGIYTAFFQHLGDVSRYYSADSIFFTIPLSMLNDDDGHMNIALVLGTSTGGITEWVEWVPEVGNGVIGAPYTAWLTAEPMTGSVATNDSLAVTASLDSTGLQPGLYPASLHIHSNDPTTPVASLPITMTVEPTASMGWVEGTIRDGRFHHPLVADVVAHGEPYLVTSDEDGTYRLWLEAGTYTLEVMAAGYVSATVPVMITAQSATVQNIDLVEDVPVFALSPDSLTLTLSAGTITTETAVITNDGPALLNFGAYVIDTTGTQTVAAALGQGNVNLLSWTRYTSGNNKYQNVLNALSQHVPFTLTETDTEDAATLSGLLATADVLLVPEQSASGAYLQILGAAWANVLQTFVDRGGTIVLLDYCSQTHLLLQGAELIDTVFSYCSFSMMAELLMPEHPLAAAMPDTFEIQGGLAVYNPLEGDNIIARQNFPDDILVFAREINYGRVAVLGFDFSSYNNDMAQLLANAVQWQEPSPTWLTVTPVTGTVAAYDTLPLSLVIDTTGFYPGDYTADFIVATNDPYTSTRSLPINLTVEPSATMGQVVGTVRHAWTGQPLTATVALQGVYTTTATPDFAIWAEAGDYTLTAVADGYVSMAINVSILAGELVEVDLLLAPLQPRLEGMIESITETAVTGQTITHTFTLTNAGPVALNYEWAAGVAWLMLEPAAGSIPAYDSHSFTLLLDATALQPDVYEATLSLSHNDPELISPLTVPVMFNVQDDDDDDDDDDEAGVWLYLPVVIRP